MKYNNHFLQMGCYGIGVSRIIAAAIEQNYDANGIIWPKSISPFDVVLIEIDGDKNKDVREYSENIYEMLIDKELDIILDEMHSMVEELDSRNPLPEQEVRPKTIEELIQQSKGGG